MALPALRVLRERPRVRNDEASATLTDPHIVIDALQLFFEYLPGVELGVVILFAQQVHQLSAAGTLPRMIPAAMTDIEQECDNGQEHRQKRPVVRTSLYDARCDSRG